MGGEGGQWPAEEDGNGRWLATKDDDERWSAGERQREVGDVGRQGEVIGVGRRKVAGGGGRSEAADGGRCLPLDSKGRQMASSGRWRWEVVGSNGWQQTTGTK